MKNLLNNTYELIWEINSELISGVYLVKHKETHEEYVMKEILQETDENDSKILKKEFEALVKQGATLDGTEQSPLMIDFFIEEGHKYLVLEAYKDGGTLIWLEAFPSIGYIFKNCYVVAYGIAAGGFGVVYQVIDANIPGKFWALKEMYDVCENPEAVERSFRVEAEILAALDHRAIPIIVSFFTEDGKHYLVMEYIKGNTLEDMLDSLKNDEFFPEKIILEWAIQICEVIEYLHTRPKPVVFRDLKPDNIIFTCEKELKLIDFGISCIFQGPKGKTTLHALLSEGYAPQEQWLGKAEPRSDIYSLGATLHHIITKIHPRISAPDFPSVDQINPLVSRELSLVISRSLQAKPSDRYETISEMKNEFLKLQKKQRDFVKEYELLESGENFERKDDNFKALSEYIKILELNPVSERAHYRLAICYEKLGFKDKAIEHYHKAIEYSASSDIKEKSEERLKSLAGEIVEKSMKLKPEHIIDEIEAIPAGNLEHGSYLSPKDFTLTTRFGHTSGVASVSFIYDSKLIASAGQDGTIKIWDIHKKILLHTLEEQRGEIKSISISRDGRYMASSGSNVTLWDIKSKTLLHMFQELEEGIEKVEFDSTGNILISAGGNKIYLHNREEGRLICTLEGHHDKIKTFALSPDDKFLYSAGRDLWVNLWDLETKTLIYSFNENSEPVKAVSISPDSMLMAVMNGNKINIWDLKKREIKHVFEGHTDKIESLSFSPDGKFLASGSRDRAIKIWDITSGKQEHTVSGHTGWISDIKWSHDGKLIISGSSDKTVKMWDSEQMDLIYTFGGDYGSVEALSINPEGSVLAAGYSDHTIKLWGIKTKSLIAVLEKHTDVVSALSYSPDGKYLASGSWDEIIHIWDIDKGKVCMTVDEESGLVGSLVYSKEGDLIATGGADKTIRLWDAETGEQDTTFEVPDWSVEAIDFNHDGSLLAVGGSSNTVTIWDIEDEEELACLEGHRGSVLSVDFSPSGKKILSGSKDNSVKLWSIKEGSLFSPGVKTDLIHTFEGHSGSVSCVCFNKEETLIASGGKDNLIKIWDGKTFELICTFKGHNLPVTCLAFSGDSKYIFSGSKDGTIKIWSIKEKILMSTLIALNKEGTYEYISYSPDNSYSCSEGGREFIVFEKIRA